MSDSECIRDTKITSVVKTKDPRRVEAGKRLGMISKQAKERKAREQSDVEAKEKNDDWFPNASVSSPVVGVGIAGLAGLVLYYGLRFAYVKKNNVKTVKTSASDTSETQTETKPKRVYKELDTLD